MPDNQKNPGNNLSMRSARPEQIPTLQEWNQIDPRCDNIDHIDIRHAFVKFGGSSREKYREMIFSNGLPFAHDLTILPNAVFRYYVFAFVDVLSNPDLDWGKNRFERPDTASGFIRAVSERMKRNPGSFEGIYPEIKTALDAISDHQEKYEASRDIYGSFSEIRDEIDSAWNLYESDKER